MNSAELNPWFAMWTKPRAAIQQVVDNNPGYLVKTLACISGFSSLINLAVNQHLGDKYPLYVIFLMAIILGSLLGFLILYVGGSIIRLTGMWMGGLASLKNIQAALAWSNIPIIWALALRVPELMLFRMELFTSETPVLNSNPYLAILMLGFGLAELVIGLFGFIVLFKCLSQVQGYSIWKAILNIIISLFVVIFPIAAIFTWIF